RHNWDDDYNQDIYGSKETGKVYGSGTPQKNSTPPAWSPPVRSKPYPSPSVSPLSSSPVPKAEPAKPKEQQYKSGDRVRHDKFGEGIVLKSEMESGTEFVEVQFQGKFGKKSLSMDFAKLEKLSSYD